MASIVKMWQSVVNFFMEGLRYNGEYYGHGYVAPPRDPADKGYEVMDD